MRCKIVLPSQGFSLHAESSNGHKAMLIVITNIWQKLSFGERYRPAMCQVQKMKDRIRMTSSLSTETFERSL